MEKTTVRFRVSGQELTMVGNYHRFASNSVGLVRIEVEPSDEWLSFDSVDCIFQNDQDRTTMTMFYEFSAYACMVPANMLSRISKVLINLSGKNMVDGDLVERLTTYPTLAFVVDVSSNVANYRETVIPANQYEQFVELVGRQANKLADVEVSAHESDVPEVLKTYSPDAPMSLDFGLVTGAAAGFGAATASIDDNVGTPSVEVTTSGPDTAKVFDFAFSNMKGNTGEKGDTGDAAGFGTVSATVDANHGTPAVTVTTSGDDTAKNFAFDFKNLQPAPYDDSVIQARMDTFTNLAAGSTTGDAELADGRVGADGVTYTNIGGAIRGQVTDLKSELNTTNDAVGFKDAVLNSLTWSNAIPNQTTGIPAYSATRLCTQKIKIPAYAKELIMTVQSGYKCAWYAYGADGTTFLDKQYWLTATTNRIAIQPSWEYLIVGLSTSNNTNISASEASNITVSFSTSLQDLNSDKLDNYTAHDFSVTNSRINASGAFITQNGCYRTDYIPCIPNMVVKFHGRSSWYQGEPIVSLIAFYDADKTFISSITKFSDEETSATIGYLEATVPNNAYYVASCTSALADDFYFHLSDIQNLIDNIPNIEDVLSKTFFNVNDTSVNNLDWVIGSLSSGTGAELASTTRVRSKFIKVGKNTTLRINNSETYSYLYYLFDLNKKIIVAKDWTTKDITIENDCYIRILVRYTDNRTITEDTRISVASQLQLFYVAPTSEIIDANAIYNIPANTRKKAEIEVFKQKKTSSEAYGQCDLKMMFFTDVHGDSARTQRMTDLVKAWGTSYFDVAVCGGDIAQYTINESLDWYYDDVDGIGVPVLNAVGNHDAWSNMSPVTLAPQTDVYNKIIAPIVSSAGITQPTGASTNGYCYYYKDIGNVRVIVLDCMYWDATQLDWFVSVLSDAKTNSKHVLCVSHSAFPIANMEKVDCLWSKTGINTDSVRTNIQAASAVKDFMDDGGVFIAWLVGHQHGDYVHKLPNYNDQIVINLASFAQRAGWLLKNTDPTKYNYDCLTYVAVDTSYTKLKLMRIGADIDIFGTKYDGLVVDYTTNEVISSW